MKLGNLRWGLVACVALAVGCTAGEDPEPDPADPNDPTRPPPNAAQCGDDCTTDLAAARAALEAGNFTRALNLYRCADTPEAAFGAGLSRLLVMLEGDAADGLAADLGLAPLVAADFLGPDSIIARLGSRWDGGGSVDVSGDLTATLAFDVGQQATGSYGYFSAQTVTSSDYSYLDIEVEDSAALQASTVMNVTFDCAASYPRRLVDPPLSYVDLRFEQGNTTYYCSLPYGVESTACETDGGSIVVTAAGTTPGQHVAYQLENLLLTCSDEDSWDVEYAVRVSGTADGVVVTPSVDTSGLHPMFSEDYDFEANLPSATTIATLQQGVAALTPELEEAACYFRRAGGGTGTVFQFPGALTGGDDVPFSQGDAQVLGAALLASAAFIQLASAAEVPMPIHDLICDSEDPACPTEEKLTATFNQTLGQTFHAEQFAVAQRLVSEAAPLLDAGLGNLDETSLLVANATSMSGLLMIRDVVQAVNAALTVRTVIPHVAPAVHLDLKAFFSAARNPQDVGVPPLEWVEDCDQWDCWSYSELNLSFLEAYLEGTTDADWVDGDYTWEDEDAVEDALGESFSHALGTFVGGGD